ncbi:Sortase family protein [Amycolatopsis tolypomycina]|uniref:Sortase family protein n=1 Tax=Amycolatopsis tolypomycina TaxID=208445 RepID=A0A1H4ZEL9_9PSEU|nr:class F sortase [Amycolatopsis tolypomycina]SED28533.1 Sortase family protein [Amycolatopsis tolypomycina]
MQDRNPEEPKKGFGRWWIVGVAGAFVVAALVATLLVFTGKNEPADANGTGTPVPVAGRQAPQGTQPDTGHAPAQLALPGGGTAKLVQEDLDANGALKIPEGLDEAAWWGAKLGADRGVALLSGHVNWKGKKGPFTELWQVKPGQEVKLTDAGGGAWVYRIDAAETVHKSDLAGRSEQLFDPDGPHKLLLVTCGGEYVGGSEGYEDNRVVTASLVTRP